MTQPFGAIEAGGTKFVCLVGSGPDDIRAETRLRLRADNGARMKSVMLDGRPWARFDPTSEVVILPAGTRGAVELLVRY